MKLKMPKKKIKFGDFVQVKLNTIEVEVDGYVIGFMDDDGVMLADNEYLHMPVRRSGCEVVSSGHLSTCTRLRDRYIAKFGATKLLPLENN